MNTSSSVGVPELDAAEREPAVGEQRRRRRDQLRRLAGDVQAHPPLRVVGLRRRLGQRLDLLDAAQRRERVDQRLGACPLSPA